jgi:hypothetical protein
MRGQKTDSAPVKNGIAKRSVHNGEEEAEAKAYRVTPQTPCIARFLEIAR